MAVKFRAVSTAINVDGVDQQSVTVSKPTGTSEGDVMILVTNGYTGDGGMAGVDAQGFTLLNIVDDSTGTRSRAWKKIAGASEPASYTINFAGAVTGAVSASLASFAGGHDVLTWASRVTSTTDPAAGYGLDCARDAVAWQVYCYRNDTANTTVTWSGGTEKFDICAKASTAIRRGQSGMYYGPADTTDIVNAGDAMPAEDANPAQAPLYGIAWNFLVGDKEQDTEPWSAVNGDFAVEVNMDRVELNGTGSISTRFAGDATSSVSAFAASAETEAASRAADGLASTNWLDSVTAAPQWLRYDFGVGVTKEIHRYRITSAATGSTFSDTLDPMDWTLEGSQNASSWTVLDTRANETFGNRSETREFGVTTPGAYRYYRINVTKNFGSGATTGCQIAEFRLSTVSVWEDVTTFVNEDDKIRITRGFQGTSGRSDFSRAYFSLNNTDGRFSLRNPNGAYHGAIQRNSQVRISKAFGTKALQLQGGAKIEGTDMIGDTFRTPLTTALAVTGDIDIRMDMDLESWHAIQSLASAAVDSVDAPDRGWGLFIGDDGKIYFNWWNASGVQIAPNSTVALPDAVRQAIKVTVDMDNGAGGATTTFYTAPTIAGPYTQLGDPVVTSGTSQILYNGGTLSIGHTGSDSPRALHGKVYGFELRNGIGGTAVTSLDFTSMTNGAHTHTDSNGNLWISILNSVVSNRRYRFHGEIAEWPVAWDTTGNWIWAPITAAGVQKRLERASSTGSAMYRHHTKGIISDPGFDFQRNVAQAYWPLEDGKNAFQAASGLPGKPHMEVYGSPTFANYSDFQESDPIVTLNSAKLGGRAVDTTAEFVDVRWIMACPTAPPTNANFITLYTVGGVVKWEIGVDGSNQWHIYAYTEADAETGTPTFAQSGIALTTTGEKMHVRLTLSTFVFDVNITLDARSVQGEDLGGGSYTFVGAGPMERVYRVQVNDHDAVRLTDTAIGHVAVYGTDSPDWESPINAWHYERAADRIKRICDEEDIQYRQIGAATKSTFMGFQDAASPQEIMSSASVSDIGYLVDPLDAFGIEYRTGRSLFNQEARLTLSYTGNELSGELRPVDDDSYLTNDFTASRGEAGSARFRLTDGALSVNPPPLGVGEYADTQSFSLAHEGQCVDLASWHVHQGTLDEEHYPKLMVALENLRIAASSTLTEAVLDLDIGQRVDITDTPSFLPAVDIRQIVIGYEEWFDNFQHNIKMNTIPERAFESAQYNTDYRFDTAGSELYADITAAATTMRVATTLGPTWSTDGDDFDLWVDGEQMTCTAISNDTTNDSSDTFNRADSTTNLGSTDGGVVQAWTQNSGTWGILTNRAYISAAANSIATIAGTADFNELRVDVPVWGSGDAWLVFRLSGTSNYLRFGGTVGAVATFEVFQGGITTRSDASSVILAAGDTLRVAATGGVIRMFVNDVMVLTVFENTHVTNTRVGMRTQSTVPRFDNFAFDYAVSPQTFTVTRSVNGVVASHPAGTAVSLYKKPYRAL